MEWSRYLKRALFAIAATTFAATAVAEPAVLNVYGPGGPAPAMKEAAEAFGTKNNVKVNISAGPAQQWMGKAKDDADIIYSGAEFMMTDFVGAMDGRIDETTITPLYIRPSAILVRPGNPRKIRGFKDLYQPGVRIMVVNGAGQTGMWEDMVGRDGDVESIRKFRANIVEFAKNSGEAKKTWTKNKAIDAWLIYNIWQLANPELADVVPVERHYVVYRDTGVALTIKGKSNAQSAAFVEFLQSDRGREIFEKWGWMTKAKH